MKIAPATALSQKIHQHRHRTLLAVLVAVFAVRPMVGNYRAALVMLSLALVALGMAALYALHVDELLGEREASIAERKRSERAGWMLAVIAIAGRLIAMVVPTSGLELAVSIVWMVFVCFITWQELRGLLRQRAVTGDTICMAISVYLLLGLAWGFVYDVTYQLQPGAFDFSNSTKLAVANPADAQAGIFAILIYFSMMTLTTVGYGDITPLTLQARYIALAEAVTGQFYIAILVARLVAMQMSSSARQS